MDGKAPEPGAEERRDPAGRTPLIWFAAGLVGVIVVTILINVLRSPASYPPGSPEAAVQGYLQAVLDGDDDGAFARFTPELRERCASRDLDETFVPDQVRITLAETDIDADDARVTIRLRFDRDSDPFDAGSFDSFERIDLTRVGGEWLIDEEPWPVFFCGR